MVNAVIVKRKFASSLVNEKNCSNRNEKVGEPITVVRIGLSSLRKKPEKFNTLTNRIIADLTALEKAVSNDS